MLAALLPGATILELGEWAFAGTRGADPELMRLHRGFLDGPGRRLRHLLEHGRACGLHDGGRGGEARSARSRVTAGRADDIRPAEDGSLRAGPIAAKISFPGRTARTSAGTGGGRPLGSGERLIGLDDHDGRGSWECVPETRSH